MRRDGAGPGRRGARRRRSTALGRHGLFRLLSLNCPARPGVPPDELVHIDEKAPDGWRVAGRDPDGTTASGG
ncbi:MAG: hypothetical protein QOC93_2429 [Actinomycetota bacterium]|jgi:hypothetical protein|nr:hypothetical protein [Actinomycetota bacterium]